MGRRVTARRSPPGGEWRRYAAPAAFLLAVTIAVVLVRAGLESGSDHASRHAAIPPPPATRVRTTAAATTGTRQAPRAARRYWTVRAGDTFGVIASATGVPVAQIQQLNPQASSTSLHIGEKIRIR